MSMPHVREKDKKPTLYAVWIEIDTGPEMEHGPSRRMDILLNVGVIIAWLIFAYIGWRYRDMWK